MEGCGMAVVWSWIHWSAAAPLGCAVLHREPCSAPVSLGLRPHSHLGHREKECADLMMYRKSEEPHSDPGAAIGRHHSSESPAHSELEPRKKTMWKHSMWIHSQSVCMGDVFYTATLLVVPLLQSPLQRSRRSQRGKTESRRVETECEELYPLKADGKLAGGTEGLSTEADCHKWLQLLLRPWSWLQ